MFGFTIITLLGSYCNHENQRHKPKPKPTNYVIKLSDIFHYLLNKTLVGKFMKIQYVLDVTAGVVIRFRVYVS